LHRKVVMPGVPGFIEPFSGKGKMESTRLLHKGKTRSNGPSASDLGNLRVSKIC
jgi:hypothetical protein